MPKSTLTDRLALRDRLAAAEDENDDLKAMLGDVCAVEVVGARIVVEWIEHPGGRVGLDVSGNLVRVEFDGTAAVDR